MIADLSMVSSARHIRNYVWSERAICRASRHSTPQRKGGLYATLLEKTLFYRARSIAASLLPSGLAEGSLAFVNRPFEFYAPSGIIGLYCRRSILSRRVNYRPPVPLSSRNIGDISRENYGLREKESSPSWRLFSRLFSRCLRIINDPGWRRCATSAKLVQSQSLAYCRMR